MFDSIYKDIRYHFSFGDIITKLIFINVGVFIITALVKAFVPSFYVQLLPYFALSSDFSSVIYKPWTILTHGFIHASFSHLLFNMLSLFWLGNIGADLLGQKRILPVYFTGMLVGGLFFIGSSYILLNVGSYALGSSAAVMAIIFMSVMAAPDYEVSLILLGRVKIKYIALALLFFDIIGVAGFYNSGGHAAHLGGILTGMVYVMLLRGGRDVFGFRSKDKNIRSKQKKQTLKVVHKREIKLKDNESKAIMQHQVDKILDKIKLTGYDSLTEEEKEILFKASHQ
ncbi:MAG: rhomboid family intramembrane serine protease [Saprospiraceae bacterium]